MVVTSRGLNKQGRESQLVCACSSYHKASC